MDEMRKEEELRNTPGAFLHIPQMMIYHMQGVNPWMYKDENPFELAKYLDRVERAKHAMQKQ